MTDKFLEEFESDYLDMLDSYETITTEEMDDLALDVLSSMLIYYSDIIDHWIRAGMPEPNDDIPGQTITERMARALIEHALVNTDLRELAEKSLIEIKE